MTDGDGTAASYRVAEEWALPDLCVAPGVATESASRRLRTVYYDSAARDLLAHGVTLHRDSDGVEPVWRLTLPTHGGPSEVQAPVAGRGVPQPLRDLVLGLRRGSPLRPMITLDTDRTTHRVIDDAGAVVAEILDEHVTRSDAGPAAQVEGWREVRVVGGDDSARRAVRRRLEKAGGKRAKGASPNDRILAGSPTEVAGPARTIGALALNYLRAQHAAIVRGDLDLRQGHNVVHPTRVALRRYRSVLRVFGDLFDAEQAEVLQAELAWYAGLLGTVRDSQVLAAHLREELDALPDELILGPVGARITSTLAGEEADARAVLERAMAGRRYFALLGQLRIWDQEPPWTQRAERDAKSVAGYVRVSQRAVARRTKQARRHNRADESGLLAAIHRTRKAAKRARYVAELAEPVLGKTAGKSAARYTRVQDRLGAIQDAVVASVFLRRLGAAAGPARGENGFTFGMLLATERASLQLDAMMDALGA